MRYKPKRKIRREISAKGFIRPIVIVLYPEGTIELHEKGYHKKFSVDVGSLYLLAVRQYVEKEQTSKKRRSRSRYKSIAG